MTIPDLSQNNEAVDGFLSSFVVAGEDDAQQHGVKGQKWGVRKDSPAGGAKATAVKEAVRRATGAALGINNNPRYKGKDLTKDSALKMQYDRDVKHAFKHELKVVAARTAVVAGVAAVAPAFPAAFTAVAAIAAHRIITTSTSSRIITGDFGVPSDAASSTFFMDSGLQHAAITGRTTYVLTADRDAKGFITKLFADELVVAHTDGNVDGVLASIVEIKEDDAEQHGVKGQKWGVRKADAIGVSSLASGGMTVTTMPSKSTAQGGKEPGIKSADNVAVATHNIAKNLSDGPNTEKVWAGIHNEIVAKTGNGNSLTAKNMPVVNEIVAKHLTKAANEMTAAGTSSRVMVSHTLNKKLSPQGIPMIHLIVGKKQSDVDAYVDLTKSSLNGSKSALDPNKDWIVHSADAPKVEVVSLKPVLDKGGFIVGIKAPTIMHVDQQVDDILKSIVEAGDDDAQQHGIKGMKWGVRRSVDSATGRVEMTGSTGLNPRRGSADQIAQDRIQKKIDSVGVHALSTAELQSYSRRLQVEKDVNRVLAEQSAAQKAASQSFITKFVKKQAGRQTNRVIDKALDVAVEKALHEAGIKIGKKGGNPDAADLLVKTATRLAPKKGK